MFRGSVVAQTADPTLVAAYHCNEGTGGVLNDVSGNGNHGTVNAGWNATGRYGAALNFNGSGNTVTVPDSASLDLTNSMTIEAWVYPTATTAWQTVLMKESPNGLAYALYSRVATNRPGVYIHTTSDIAASSGTGVPRNAWTHLAATYNGATLSLYVNGTLRTSIAHAGSILVTGSRLSIGGNSFWGEYFTGRIDEIRIYRRVLTASEIQADMAAPISSRPGVTITSPASGSVLSGIVNIIATTTGSNLAGVQFQLDGANLGSEDTTSPYGIPWDTSTATNGSHVLTAVVRDTGGTTTTSSPVTVSVANGVAPPQVTITAPAPGSVSGTITVAADASDAGGIAGVQFLLDGANLGAEDTIFPYAISWNTSSTNDGNHTLSARARGTSGLTATSAPISILVANTSNPSISGQWSPVENWPIVTVHGVLLHTGKVLIFDRPSAGPTARVWDPATNAFTSVPNSTTDLFCAGHVSMSDGRVLVVGGHGGGPPNQGTADVNIFDPVGLNWTLVRSMAFKRWYPTATALPDGRVLVMSGSATNLTDYIATPEVYDPANNTWTRLTSAALTMPTYPQMFVLPDGRIANPGNYEYPAPTRILNLANQTWTTVDATSRDGGSVMYEPGKVLKCGSSADSGFSGPAAATTFAIDFTSPTPTWQQTASMSYPRAHHGMTILADGKVLVTGGGTQRDGYYVENAVYHPELWDPATKTWAVMAPASRPRLYHSIAMLLPDGRVLSSGGGRDGPGVDQLNAAIFSPPYLFKGARPAIQSAPDVVAYSSSFELQTPDAATVAAVHLIKIGAPTHAYDQDQRLVKLSFAPAAGGLSILAPANANIAPPGHYMLFLINGNGVPSVSRIVRLQLGPPAGPPSAPENLVATGGLGTVSLSWSASTGGAGIANYNVHRSTSAGFTPSAANRVAQPIDTSFVDSGLGAGRYYYLVTAQSISGQLSGASNQAFADVAADTSPPEVTLTSPTSPNVSGTITVSANATDDVGVAGVQFLLDGSPLATEVLSPPYAITWNTSLTPNGTHTLAARARDLGGNTTTTIPFSVTVFNDGPTGLVLAMAFNEGVGTTTEDRSGYSHNGLLQSATWTPSGKFGGALSFNGTNSHVLINDAPALDLSTGMTLMAWVNPSVSSDWRTVILKEAPGNLAYALYSSTDTNRPGGYFLRSGTTLEVKGGTQLPLNTWSHIAVTWNGSTFALFINGNQVASISASGPINQTAAPLKIGGNAVWSEWFQGVIDEVRIYNRALTVSELQSVKDTPIAP
jgi:hypothetical protein